MLKCPSRASCGCGVVVVVDNNSMNLQKPLQVDRFWRRYCKLLLPKEGAQRTARWRARYLDDGECGPQLRLPLLAAWDQRPSLVAESVELVERPVLFGVQLPPCEPRVVGPVAQGSEDPALVLALGGHDVKG